MLAEALGRTNNLVGEYAEYLVCNYCNGELLKASHKSADVKDEEGFLYQVKSRKIKNSSTTQLSIIRSWDFDYLIVILFRSCGEVFKAIKVPVYVAREYSVEKEYEKGFVITTNNKFLSDSRCTDITNEI